MWSATDQLPYTRYLAGVESLRLVVAAAVLSCDRAPRRGPAGVPETTLGDAEARDWEGTVSERILITGAGAGIGREVSVQLAAEGYQLALVDSNLEALERLQKHLSSECPGLKVEIESLNITDFDRVGLVFDSLARKLGGLDIVLANAGVDGGTDIGDEDNFPAVRKVIEVNLLGTIACIEKAVSIFKDQGHGHIAVTSSYALKV